MSDNVIYLTPQSKLDDFDRDMVGLEIASLASHQRLESIRDRVGKIIGKDYMFALLEYLFSGKPVLPEGFDPTKCQLPYQYRYHLDLMDERGLEVFFRTISALMKKSYDNSCRSRRELFYLRSEVMRRLEKIKGAGIESPEFADPPSHGGKPKLSVVNNE